MEYGSRFWRSGWGLPIALVIALVPLLFLLMR